MTNWADAYKQYSPEIRAFLERRLWGRLPSLAKERTRVSALFVAGSGEVEEVQ